MVRPFILVLAGVNGAGKSSVGGAMLADQGLHWFNPDTHARNLLKQLSLPLEEANSRAWTHGKVALESAMANRTNHAFETTLGGATMTRLLVEAAQTHAVVMIFCGLTSPELHIERVAQRVALGGAGTAGRCAVCRPHAGARHERRSDHLPRTPGPGIFGRRSTLGATHCRGGHSNH